jgi:hypothetical protein
MHSKRRDRDYVCNSTTQQRPRCESHDNTFSNSMCFQVQVGWQHEHCVFANVDVKVYIGTLVLSIVGSTWQKGTHDTEKEESSQTD